MKPECRPIPIRASQRNALKKPTSAISGPPEERTEKTHVSDVWARQRNALKNPRQRCLGPPEERTEKTHVSDVWARQRNALKKERKKRQRCLGPPEERTEDGAVLSGRSEKTRQRCLTLDSFHFFPGGSGSSIGLTSKGYAFLNADSLNLLLPDRAIFSR